MYGQPFFITDCVGNNAFSFEKRVTPKLYVPSVIDGTIDDVQEGDEIVFEDFDETGKLMSCTGLKNFVRFKHPLTEKPVVIADNHNHVFYFWYEARKNGYIGNGARLIHIDQHKDMREPATSLTREDSADLQKVFDYTNTVLNVGDYIIPAMENGLISELISVTSEKELTTEGGKSIIRQPVIVNIDLDFWSPEMDYIDVTLKNKFTKARMKEADLITIATSPFFIAQARAISVLRTLMEID